MFSISDPNNRNTPQYNASTVAPFWWSDAQHVEPSRAPKDLLFHRLLLDLDLELEKNKLPNNPILPLKALLSSF